MNNPTVFEAHVRDEGADQITVAFVEAADLVSAAQSVATEMPKVEILSVKVRKDVELL